MLVTDCRCPPHSHVKRIPLIALLIYSRFHLPRPRNEQGFHDRVKIPGLLKFFRTEPICFLNGKGKAS
ncbi:MAG: hypothetical protein DRH20_06495 [Deltaproteobacteria bacterium]|nr:MAG: hypothetical protein DRH20_06495 [Deltaproteobacteria bacterium]